MRREGFGQGTHCCFHPSTPGTLSRPRRRAWCSCCPMCSAAVEPASSRMPLLPAGPSLCMQRHPHSHAPLSYPTLPPGAPCTAPSCKRPGRAPAAARRWVCSPVYACAERPGPCCWSVCAGAATNGACPALRNNAIARELGKNLQQLLTCCCVVCTAGVVPACWRSPPPDAPAFAIPSTIVLPTSVLNHRLPPPFQAPKRKDAGLLRQAEALLAARGVPVEVRGRHHLNLLSNDRPHGVSGGAAERAQGALGACRAMSAGRTRGAPAYAVCRIKCEGGGNGGEGREAGCGAPTLSPEQARVAVVCRQPPPSRAWQWGFPIGCLPSVSGLCRQRLPAAGLQALRTQPCLMWARC